MRFLAIALFLSVLGNSLTAQKITHGPVTGAVTPETARIYVRTTMPAQVRILADEDPQFGSPFQFDGSTTALLDTSVIIPLQGLLPQTRYYLRFLVDGQQDTVVGSFKTFPPHGSRGNYSMAVLSCQEFGTYNAFLALRQQNPDLVLHTGDWTYPDYQLPGDHRMDKETLKWSYRRRYSEPKMPPCLHNMAFDYVVDNHDGIECRTNGTASYFVRDTLTGAIQNYITFDPTPAGAFENMMEAYQNYYPAYPLYDSTNGMYHSYRFGNAEIFFVDVRNCGNGQDSTYRFDSINKVWLIDPTPGQTLLGRQQFDWLLNGLSNSTADWKFIVSGVMFNRGFRKVAQVALALQGMYFDAGGQSGTGFRLAHAITANWPGYYREQDSLLNFIRQRGIKDVVVLSGHVHTSVMDDGKNAGLPEMNVGPTAGYGAELTYYIDSIMQILNMGTIKDSLWNGGGLGVDNTNFKSAFGKVEVFGNDSLRLCIVDEDNLPVSCMSLVHSSKQSSTLTDPQETPCSLMGVFPNPAKQEINLKFCGSYKPGPGARFCIIDLSGRIAQSFSSFKGGGIKLSGYAAGKYILFYEDGTHFESTPFQVTD